MLATGLLVVHDASRGGQDDIAELTRGQQADSPLLKIRELDIVAGRDDTSLVEAIARGSASFILRLVLELVRYIPADQLDNNLAGAVVIDLLELANVACEAHEVSANVA